MESYKKIGLYIGFTMLSASITVFVLFSFIYNIVSFGAGILALTISIIWITILFSLLSKAYLYETKNPIWSTVLPDEEASNIFINMITERLNEMKFKFQIDKMPNYIRVKIVKPHLVNIEIFRRIPLPIKTFGIWGLKLFSFPRIIRIPTRRGLILRIMPDRKGTPKELRLIISESLANINLHREAKYWGG